MKKILVTGGMGFIGRPLLREILKKNDDCVVVVVDNLSTEVCEEYVKKEIAELEADHRVQFIKMNFEEFITDQKYDEIYHLASPVGPVGVLKYSGKMGVVIINNLYKAIQMASEMGAKLMYVSTSEVYGCNPIFDQPEDIQKIVPAKITTRLEYGVSKLLGEVILENTEGLSYNAIRPFNIIGRGQNADLGFVIPRFIDQALRGEDITVYGDGTNRRTFTDVRDITEAMVLIMNSSITRTVFNIGNPDNQITIGELARKIKAITESKAEVKFVDPKTLHGDKFAEAWNKIPNIDRVRSLIGWSPKYDLETTLRDCIEMEREELCNPA
ncbi:MAG: NAD-dependent epimerase/dehydratase family protein [Proteobacteria bacterium]|jgi:nucleoside-diphosphate-sugar epimerase|nr:NAD-dependent epimerase/dehydratase family protein [Pseudomonadota bacterium]